MPTPEQSLLAAQRSLRLLGIMSALFGVVMIVAFGYLNRFTRFRPYFIGLGFLVWFLPGVLMVTCWWYLQRRNRMALRVAFAVCAVQTAWYGVETGRGRREAGQLPGSW